MNFNRFLLLMLVLCFTELTIYPELLVIKKNTDGLFTSLDKTESLIYGPVISQILLKYEWPMCIASNLTKDEQNELLTAGMPYGEEIFIQKKLKESIPDLDLGVVFIPTALYELFCLSEFFKIKKVYPYRDNHPFREENSFEKAVISILYNKFIASKSHPNKFSIDFSKTLNTASASLAYEKMYAIYLKMNNLFFDTKETSVFNMKSQENDQDGLIISFEIFSQNDENPEMYINNALVSWLFYAYPMLQESKTALEISQIIKEKHQELCVTLITKLPEIKTNVLGYDKLSSSSKLMAQMINALQAESKNQIVRKVILLEYEARKINKALILRGTSFQVYQTGLGKYPKQQMLAGTSIYEGSLNQSSKEAFEKKYKEKELKPYSISFGNSLFAGFILDAQACAYYFLMGSRLEGRSTSSFKEAGYGLLIDKVKQKQSQNNQLFFIPPLAPIAALFSYGEFFHARATAALQGQFFRSTSFDAKTRKLTDVLADKKTDRISIMGLIDGINDPFGIFVIDRDPLEHAALFSNFLAKNGRLIQSGDENRFTQEEKDFVRVIQKAQKEAAQFYKGVVSLKSLLDKKTIKMRAKKVDAASNL
jgi:hypothetical protein